MTKPIPRPVASPQLTIGEPLQFPADDNAVEGPIVVSIACSPEDDSTAVPLAAASALDAASGGVLATWLADGNASGKAGEICMAALPTKDGSVATVVMVGIGDVDELTRDSLFRHGSAVIRQLASQPRSKIVVAMGLDVPSKFHDALVAGCLFGCEGQAIYRQNPSTHVGDAIEFSGVSAEMLTRGQTIGQSINLTRRLVNEPPSIMNPTEFANRSVAMASEVGLGSEVWDETRLADERCEAILAVGRGSASPPCLLKLQHAGGADDQPPVVIVGKGVTFDSGGLSLKPSEGMVDMKCDMAGAATVVGVMHAIAKLGVGLNVIGLCGLAENMVSGDSYKLGDVIQTRSGKTIEILNTDAEGRVVLADTLDVAVEQAPAAIVDLATLTGACMVALGNETAGLMTNDESLCNALTDAAKAEGEPVWELPMFKLFDDKVHSKVADIKNVGEGRWGGAITAAKFLENFVAEVPWLHIDIAGPAFADSPKPDRDAGATGVMVRTLIRWIENQAN
ncbi:MAG: leucyl aminopeptidase [Planctomycetota bacterium]